MRYMRWGWSDLCDCPSDLIPLIADVMTEARDGGDEEFDADDAE
jgi:hypothetical protein